jgi:drug/metabolite transporter (DMT)-like permease
MQHSAFSDTYKNEYLIVTFLGSAFWLIVMGFIFERDSFKFTLRHGLLFGFGAGIFNGITNVLTIVSYNFFPLSFLSPVKTGLSMTLGFLVSTVIYKETFTRRQIIGVVLGVLSAILMNL